MDAKRPNNRIKIRAGLVTTAVRQNPFKTQLQKAYGVRVQDDEGGVRIGEDYKKTDKRCQEKNPGKNGLYFVNGRTGIVKD